MLLRGAQRHRSHLTLALAAAGSVAFAPAADAHPHVWATVRSEILFGPNHQIIGIRHAWTFDEFYTAMAIEGLDTNKDGIYSKEELQALAKVNVESLKDFDYFTDTKALTESFFSQLGPNSNFGSQFAQTATVKCKDSHL